MEACANCCVGQIPFTIQHLFLGATFLTIKVKTLSLDTFKLVVLRMKHVNISYNSRVSKIIECIIDDKTRGAARVENGVIGVLDTWAMEVGGRVRACIEGGAIDGLVFAFCSLVDNTIVD